MRSFSVIPVPPRVGLSPGDIGPWTFANLSRFPTGTRLLPDGTISPARFTNSSIFGSRTRLTLGAVDGTISPARFTNSSTLSVGTTLAVRGADGTFRLPALTNTSTLSTATTLAVRGAAGTFRLPALTNVSTFGSTALRSGSPPFGLRDWPNPMRRRWSQPDLLSSTALHTTIALPPFALEDWPNPVRRRWSQQPELLGPGALRTPPITSTWSSTLNFGPGTATVLTNGNLTNDRGGGGNWISTLSNSNRSAGLLHMEMTPHEFPWIQSNGSTPGVAVLAFGVDDNTTSVVSNLKYPGQDTHGVGWWADGSTYQASGLVMPLMSPAQTYAMEIDLTHGKLWWGHKPYCSVWNPKSGFASEYLQVDSSFGTIAQRAAGGGNWTAGKASVFQSSGLLHVEFRFSGGTPGTNVVAGLVNAAFDSVGSLIYPGQSTSTGIGCRGDGTTYGMGGLAMPTFAFGDVLAIEIDFTHGKAWMASSSNGLWNNDVLTNQNPATNTGGVVFAVTGALVPAGSFFTTTGGINLILNAAGSFTVTPSSGFNEWDHSTDAIWWNNDVLANQNPATNTGGISLSGVTGAKYVSTGCYQATLGQCTAQFGLGSGFTLPVSSGFSNWG
jgi:hypothetical protein